MDDINKHYPMATVVPVLSFFSIAVCITPLILHAKNRNLPAASLICWTILLNLFNIINAFIWPTDNVDLWWDGAGLCDVEVKLMVGSYVAFPGALVGIFRGLAIVLDTASATLVPSKTQRWRKRAVELLFCVVVPIIAMITHIVWQKSRYLLFSISGCVNNFDESWVSLVLAYMWPPIICLIAAYYCCLVLIRMRKYRSDFSLILRSANSRMSKSGFLRLFFLASAMLLAILPCEGYVVYYDLILSFPWHPYSWSGIHGPEWYQIAKYPTQGVVFFDRWTPIAAGFMLFIFFGFGRDATRIYRMFFWRIGLGYCFPVFARPTDSQASASHTDGSHSTTLVGSTISRAKLLFSWRKSSASRYDTNRGRDVPKRQWSRFSWLRSKNGGRRDEDTLLNDLSGPSQTVCTSAWAGTSQSRASSEIGVPASSGSKEGIKVKQVITQQSQLEI
ncbi:a-factor receptor [Penicillium ochrochloron]